MTGVPAATAKRRTPGRDSLRVARKEVRESLYAVRGSMWAVLSVLATWLLVFAIAAPYVLVVGAGSTVAPQALAYTFVLGTLCVGGFTALIVGASALARSGRGVTLGALAVFIAMAAPTLLGTALQKSWFGSLYNALSHPRRRRRCRGTRARRSRSGPPRRSSPATRASTSGSRSRSPTLPANP